MGRRIAGLAALLVLAASAGLGQNLVAGGTFDTSLEAWHHDPNTRGTSAWSPVLDANGSASSGSALLYSTAPEGGVLVELLHQCVPVAAGQQYVLSHKVRFADDETATGWAESVVAWFSGPICTNGISANGMFDRENGIGSLDQHERELHRAGWRGLCSRHYRGRQDRGRRAAHRECR